MEDDAPSTPSDDDDVESARRSRRTKKAGGARKSPRKKQSDSSHSTSPSSASRRKPKSIATARGSRLRSRTSALHSPSSVQDIGPMSRGKRLGTLLDAVLRKPHCPLPRAQTRCACVMNAVAVFNLLLFCVLLMLAVQTNSPFHSYDLLPTANARKFLQKADRPIKALSHENVLNTAIVEVGAGVVTPPRPHTHTPRRHCFSPPRPSPPPFSPPPALESLQPRGQPLSRSPEAEHRPALRLDRAQRRAALPHSRGHYRR